MNTHRGKFWSIVASFFLMAALAACGGGGDGGGGTPPVAAPLAGVFIDSPVAGLGYSAAPSGLSGVTNANGQLNYQPGDQITFSLGGRTVGNTVPGAPVITALQVFGATSVTDARVLNLSQLLLTLGGIPTGQNPIQLPATIPAGLPNPLNFSDPNFDAIIQSALPAGTTLISDAQATTHLQAQFSTVSVILTGAGAGSGSVTSSPAGISCTGATTCPAVFANGTSVTLTATGSGFAGWSGGTGNAAGCTGTGPCTISNLSGNSGVTATFNPPPPVTLSITKSGSGAGTVTSNPAGINCGSSCSAQFTGGTPVTMTATADAGSTFTGWSNGTGSVTCTGTGTCSATLNATSTVQATFVLNVTQFPVTPSTATANGGGGTVQCSAGGGPAGPCVSYNVGTAVTITASPNNVSNFTGWSGGTGNAAGCAGTVPCVINSLTADTTVTANFNRPTLTVQVSGTGTVNSNPTDISNCNTNCSAPFDKNTVVTLSASGGVFNGWSGGGCSGTGTCQVTVNANVSVTATFGGAVSSSPFFQFIQDDNGGPLLAIDPTTPGSSPVQVVATQEGGRYVYTASYSGNSITNLRTPYLGYISGGKLWKVTADKTINSAVPGSAGNPPIQVSNESAANNVCNAFVFHDITNINNSRTIYELAGGDNDCNTQSNNVTKMIKFSDNPSTPPTAFATGVVPAGDHQVFDLSTGALTHIFLVDTANSNTLKVLDTSTGNLTTSQANVGSVRILAQDTSNRVFLMSTSKLYLYTISTNTLTELVAAAPGSFLVNSGDRQNDGTHIYVADATPGVVKKIPLTATGSGDVTNHYTAPASVLDLQLTENRIVLKVSSNSCNQTVQGAEGLVSVRKDNSATVTNLIPVATNTCVHNNRTRGSNVFYTKSASGTQTAGVLSEDGTTVVAPITGGQWSGDAGFISFNPRTNEGGFAKLFLMTNPTPGSVNGATVSVYDWVNPTSTPLVAGTIPSTTSPLEFVQFFGDTTAALGTGFSQSTVNTEIFFLDTAIANSLVRVPMPLVRQWIPVE